MSPDELFRRYQEMQDYVGWAGDDARRVAAVGPLLADGLGALIDDFYQEVQRHPRAAQVVTGGAAQIARLKTTLEGWLRELLAGRYDADYVARRWRVGWRHVEIGLDQAYTNMALSRLRGGLHRLLGERWQGERGDLLAVTRSLDRLLDLDLAIIEDAYQTEYAARLQASERLATMGQVAGGVAHELRNPLNVVKTSVYYLLNARSPTPEKVREHLQRIEKQVTAADNVITALTNFARLPVPNAKPFAVAACVREVLELQPFPASVTVTVDCPDDLPAALADPDQVRIVLANLLRNAREAMPEGGTVTVTARQEGGLLTVAVRDTGVGIPPDRLARVMEPLYSTKARGLGLGLAISRAILEKNHGRLGVESREGQGSTFTVRLPAVPAEG